MTASGFEISPVAFQNIMRDLFVFRARMQAVNAGKIHQEDIFVSLLELCFAVFGGKYSTSPQARPAGSG